MCAPLTALESKSNSMNATDLEKVAEAKKQFEDIRRSFNVIVRGLPEGPDETRDDLIATLTNILTTDLKLANVAPVNAFRVGKPRANPPRVVKIQYTSPTKSLKVRAAASRMRESRHPNVYVDEDLSAERQRQMYLFRQSKKSNDPNNSAGPSNSLSYSQ